MTGFQVATSNLHVNFHCTNSLNITPCLFSFLVFKIILYAFVNEYIYLNTHCYMYTSIIDRKICYEFNMATFYINYIYTNNIHIFGMLLRFGDHMGAILLAFHTPNPKRLRQYCKFEKLYFRNNTNMVN